MLGLLTALFIGFTAAAPAQLVAPGPASPDPRPYGLSPGGTPMAPGPAGRGGSQPAVGVGASSAPALDARRGKKASIVNRCVRRCARVKNPRAAARCRAACR
jgi:hypothetical protein